MKKKFFLATCVAAVLISACNNSGNNSGQGDSTVSTKTTTTTVKYNRRNLENRNLVTLTTNKQIVLKYDTIHYYYVDTITNEQPITFFYDPATKDTFDYRGYIVNNSLIYKDGNYTVDETKLMENPYNLEVREDLKAVDTKIKDNGNAYKEKTDTSKIKITDRKTKIKITKPKEE